MPAGTNPDRGIREGFKDSCAVIFVANLEGALTSPTTQAGTYTFSGGTGRFSDAMGMASFTAITSDGIHVALAFEGTIDF